jgi:hypothetical protein
MNRNSVFAHTNKRTQVPCTSHRDTAPCERWLAISAEGKEVEKRRLRTERPFIEREAVSPRFVITHAFDVLDKKFRVPGDT